MKPRFLFLGAIGVCGCDRGGVAVGLPSLAMPDVVAYDRPALRQPNSVVVSVSNPGGAEAVAEFSIGGGVEILTPSITLGAGESTQVPLVWTPRAVGTALNEELVGLVGDQQFTTQVVGEVWLDQDEDGFDDVAGGGDDCDDGNAAINPGEVEVCSGQDTDCNGLVDDAADRADWFPDADGDGFGDVTAATIGACDPPDGHVEDGTDCDDSRSDVFPGAYDLPYDGVDADCAGNDDLDLDGDGFDAVQAGGSDCDDSSATRFPGAVEILDGLDQDCDGYIDEDFVAVGDITITELGLWTSLLDDRYVELVNTSAHDLDLGQLTLVGANDPISGPDLVLQADGVALLCTSLAAPYPCDGLLPPVDFVVRIDAGTLLIDTVHAGAFPTVSDASLELESDADHLTNDDAASWCVSSTPINGTAYSGTPGALNACP